MTDTEKVSDVPDEIFVLPVGTDTRDLEDEDTVVVKEIIDLAKE